VKIGDLVRYAHGDLSRKVYIIEEIADYGVNGKGQTYFLLGWDKPDTHDGRRRKFFQSQLEVISEHR